MILKKCLIKPSNKTKYGVIKDLGRQYKALYLKEYTPGFVDKKPDNKDRKELDCFVKRIVDREVIFIDFFLNNGEDIDLLRKEMESLLLPKVLTEKVDIASVSTVEQQTSSDEIESVVNLVETQNEVNSGHEPLFDKIVMFVFCEQVRRKSFALEIKSVDQFFKALGKILDETNLSEDDKNRFVDFLKEKHGPQIAEYVESRYKDPF